MSARILSIALAAGSSGHKPTMAVWHPNGNRSVNWTNNDATAKPFPNVRKGDKIFIGSADAPPVNVYVESPSNATGCVITLMDAEGAVVGSPVTIPDTGGTAAFTDAPACAYLVVS